MFKKNVEPVYWTCLTPWTVTFSMFMSWFVTLQCMTQERVCVSYVVCIRCIRCPGGWCSCPGPGARPWQHNSTAARSSRNKPPRPPCPSAPDIGSLHDSFRCCPASRDSTLPVHRGRTSAMWDNPERDSLPSAPCRTDHSLYLFYARPMLLLCLLHFTADIMEYNLLLSPG